MLVMDAVEGFDYRQLFAEDTLVSQQFEESMKTRIQFEPEKQLMLAVLEEAVYCFHKYIHASGKKGKALFRDADEWIQECDGKWLFSFESVCSFLGFEPAYIRAGLNKWKENALKQELSKSARRLLDQTNVAA